MPATCPIDLAKCARFKHWREKLGLSQRQAGALLGISHYQVCRIEVGRSHLTPTLDLLCWLLAQEDIRTRVATYVGLRHVPGAVGITDGLVG